MTPWRPRKKPRSGPMFQVHVMRRFFNYLGEKCVGIEIGHRGTMHTVTLHFNSSADASGFYQALHAIYDLASKEPSNGQS